jgi:hypothetical protein
MSRFFFGRKQKEHIEDALMCLEGKIERLQEGFWAEKEKQSLLHADLLRIISAISSPKKFRVVDTSKDSWVDPSVGNEKLTDIRKALRDDGFECSGGLQTERTELWVKLEVGPLGDTTIRA